MRAAVMHGLEDIRIETVPEPVPGPGEVLLEVHATGVCGTDLTEFIEGPSMFPIPGPHPITGHRGPMVPGHEFGGRVVAIGDTVTGFDIGDMVASGAGVSCSDCFQCRTGRTNLCEDYWTVGLQRNGALSQYVAVPATACLSVGELGLTDDSAALVQPMSIAVHAMRRGRPDGHEDVVVIGAGGIGAFLIYALSRSGVPVVAVDLNRDRLHTATRLGARDAILGGEDAHARLASVAPRPRVVYEASGSTAGLDLAFAATPPGSRIVAVGLQHRPYSLDVRMLSLQERELIGTNAHAFAADFPAAAELVAAREEGWADIAPIAVPLEDLVPVALTEMRNGAADRIKTLVDPWAQETRATVT
jgi:(R,R)-butanediol dehydrogenase/meso-butanediol dehydrogenase/diacetyl reductase